VDNFLQMAMPFINYDIESLQYEFDVLLSPELKVRENLFKDTQTNHQGIKIYYLTANFILVCVSTVLFGIASLSCIRESTGICLLYNKTFTVSFESINIYYYYYY
jgi:hypothetical protein